MSAESPETPKNQSSRWQRFVDRAAERFDPTAELGDQSLPDELTNMERDAADGEGLLPSSTHARLATVGIYGFYLTTWYEALQNSPSTWRETVSSLGLLACSVILVQNENAED